MQTILLILFCCIANICFAQNVSGKWYGKLTQKAGGYSELYDFQLDLSHKKRIHGESYAYIRGTLAVRIGLEGALVGDSVNLSERESEIREEKVPIDWIACIKNLRLKYLKKNGIDFLKGTWDGVSKDNEDQCLPGEIILSRSSVALEDFLRNDGFNRNYFIDTITPAISFTDTFKNTSVNVIKELAVHNKNIEIRLNDYLKIDDDTVSVYFNRQIVVDKQRIAKKPISIHINLDETNINEIILFAENLGRIPPNTSQLVIMDGKEKHSLIIESDKQKSAALYLKYKP